LDYAVTLLLLLLMMMIMMMIGMISISLASYPCANWRNNDFDSIPMAVLEIFWRQNQKQYRKQNDECDAERLHLLIMHSLPNLTLKAKLPVGQRVTIVAA
jgi:hypothetical protein